MSSSQLPQTLAAQSLGLRSMSTVVEGNRGSGALAFNVSGEAILGLLVEHLGDAIGHGHQSRHQEQQGNRNTQTQHRGNHRLANTVAKAPNCVLTQSQLMKEIWGPVHERDTHYLRIIISHLRKKMGDDSARPHYIVTEAGVGYRLKFEKIQ